MGKIQVQGLFATHVAALMVPDAEARHAELEEIMLRKCAERPILGASSIGGWRSMRDFEVWDGRQREGLLALARLVATKLTSDRNDAPAVRSCRGNALRNSIAFNFGPYFPL